MSRRAAVLLVCLFPFVAGCATCLSQGAFFAGRAPDNMWDAEAVIYGGTRIWIGALCNISDSWGHDPLASAVFVALGLLDLPLSIVADTVLLPVTAVEHLTR